MKSTIFVALLLIAAGPARAVNFASRGISAQAPAFNLKPWNGPLVSVILHAGVGGMQGQSKTMPTTVGLSQQVFADTAGAQKALPPVFARLMFHLAQQNADVREWAAMSQEAKLASIAQAEEAARASAIFEVEALANELIRREEQEGEMNPERAREYRDRVEALKADIDYMPNLAAMKITYMSSHIRKSLERRDEEMRDWLVYTAGKMARGDFDGTDKLFRYTPKDGLVRIADASPEHPGYPDFEAAVESRFAQIAAMPDGPWKAEMYRELANSLKEHSEVERAVGRGKREKLYERALKLESQARAVPADFARSLSALKRYREKGGAAPMKAVTRLLISYDEAARDTLGGVDKRPMWRIGSSILTGKSAEQGWLTREALKNAYADGVRRYLRLAKLGFLATAAGILAMFSAYNWAGDNAGGLAALFAIASFVFLVYNRFRYDSYRYGVDDQAASHAYHEAKRSLDALQEAGT
jgi:hypothetical protein